MAIGDRKIRGIRTPLKQFTFVGRVSPGDGDAEMVSFAAVVSALSITLNDLTDVDVGAPADGQVLTWVDANSAWEPATPVDLSTDVTLAGALDYLTIVGQEITLGAIDLTTDVTGDLPIADGGTGSSTASGARTNLGVDPAGTDNSTDVTLAGALDYLTIVGQEITLGAIDLTTDVTGRLPYANIKTMNTTRALGRSTAGTGDVEEVTASQILEWMGSLQGQIVYRSAAGWQTLAPSTSGYRLETRGVGADPVWTVPPDEVTLAGAPNYLTIVGQVITRALINLASHVTGLLPVANGGTNSSTASGARTNLGLGSAAVEDIGTSGANVPLLDGANTHSGANTFSDKIISDDATDSTSTITGAIQTDGGLGVAKTIIVGTGIKLGGSAAANLLDDYEEGTFTAGFAGSTIPGTFTYTRQNGRYTKIGDVVCFLMDIAISAIGTTPTGNLTLTGLPFTTSPNIQEIFMAHSRVTMTANATTLTAQISSAATHLTVLQSYNNGGPFNGLPAGAIAAGGAIRVSGIYFT